jgi:peptidyl-prolyl cis-trans isomerase C
MSIRFMVVAAAAVGLGLAAPAAAEGPDAGTVVARVNDTEITLGHMIAVRARLPEQFQNVADDVLFEGILDQLVEQTALADSAGDDLDLHSRILIENVTREISANSLLSRVAATAVTESAIEAAYAERYLEADPELEYNAAHILVESEEEAIALRSELEEGTDFAELAREHSLDPGSGPSGGDLGWFGAGRMVPDFEQAVMALEPGGLSEPLQTQFGWHLILLVDTRLVETPELAAVRDQIGRELQQDVVRQHIAEVREAAAVELSAEGIDPALLRDQTLLEE